jgi:hypothetical protein
MLNFYSKVIEDVLIGMRQGDRKLLVLNGNALKAVYPNAAGFIVFYDITVLRVHSIYIMAFTESNLVKIVFYHNHM